MDADRSLEDHIRLACLIEATARKPGNVHPGASFAGLSYRDLVLSAEAAAPVLARSAERGVGRTILEAVTRTRRAVGGNTNLGIILLLTPLAAVSRETPLRDGIGDVLATLTRKDARLAYEAIRLAEPGGMGRVDAEDISGDPSGTLLTVMRAAAEYDAIAAQYATNFALVLETGVPLLPQEERFAERWEEAVVRLHLTLMAACPDTLIARKRGVQEAQRSAALARDVLAAGWPQAARARTKFAELDHWLREKGNARNPGTTADLVAACLLAAFRDGLAYPPSGQEVMEKS